jgi:ribulose-bisphosphate carboxylase large chain
MHPALIGPLVKIAGNNVQIQAGGGVAGHPGGVRSGARAMVQAVEAAYEGVPFAEYSRSHKELREAINKWG